MNRFNHPSQPIGAGRVNRAGSTFSVCILAALLILLGTLQSQAHDPGLSSAKLVLQNDTLQATLTFAPADIEAICNGQKPDASALRLLAPQCIDVWFDGVPAHPSQTTAQVLPNKDVEFVLQFHAPNASHVRVRSTLLDRLPFGHRQYFAMANSNGTTLAEKLLSGDNRDVETDIPTTATVTAPPPSHPFSEFLGMGVKHILTGYDHLLFLFALLIGCKRLSSVIKVITAFTIAHSISLALATLGWVEVQSRYIEPLIAATIIYVGIENLFSRQAISHRAYLTFGFGLVHGFGFAGALREMGVGSNGASVAIPLMGFNFGVEIGQMMVAAVLLPLLWRLKDKPQFTLRWSPVCSALVVLLGGFWLIQRIASF